MTILDCCISLKMIKKSLVVLGVVDMRQLLLISSQGNGNAWSLTFKAFQNNMKNSGIIQNYLRRC